MPSDYVTDTRKSNEKTYTTWYSTQWSPAVNVVKYVGFDWESRMSRRNGWSNRRRSGTLSDVGGNFLHQKFTEVRHDAYVDEVRAYGGTAPYMEHWWGNLSCLPAITTASVQATLAGLQMGTNDMWAIGTILMERASPTAPQAGVSQALVELKREGLPKLSSDALSVFITPTKRPNLTREMLQLKKGAGGDYLNYQFGWVPLISDIKALAASVIKADDLISQLYRDNGKVVRRKRGVPVQTLSETTSLAKDYFYPSLGTYLYPIGQKLTTVDVMTKVTRRRWFSGAFVYHLPDEVTFVGSLRKAAVDARYLYGLSLDPAVIWNLLPWSWFVDWFLNVGSIFSLFSDQIYNQQVSKYGYMMCHTERVDTYSSWARLGPSGHVYQPSATRTYAVKQREKATPYGFGLSWDGFSQYQLSILSALALSRGR